MVHLFPGHDTSEASPQTDERVVSGRHPQRTPVRCMESGMVNHSVKWDRRKANRLATKAPRNRSRDERITDCHRGLEQTRCVGSPIEGDVKRHFSPSTGGGRFSRTSSPLLGLPEHFVWTAFWWRGQSGWSAFPGSVVNFPIFDRNCPKIRYSPQNICSSRSIFHNLSFSPPGVLIYEFDGVSHSPTFG